MNPRRILQALTGLLLLSEAARDALARAMVTAVHDYIEERKQEQRFD